MNTLLKKWDDLFFGMTSAFPLGVYRAIFGALVLANWVALYPTRDVWWGPHGLITPEGIGTHLGSGRLNLLALLPISETWLSIFYVGLLIFAFFLMIGFLSRISSIVVYFGLVTLAHRNPMILNSGDTFLRVTAFWLMLAPSGKAFSVDRILSRAEFPMQISAWPVRLLQIQFCCVYLTAFLSKLQGSAWRDGTAVGLALRLEEFSRFPLPAFVDSPPIIHLLTWGTLAIELALAILIWIPQLRLGVILAGIFLHLGIDYAMNIPLFEWIMIGSLSLFLTEGDWRRVWGVRILPV